MTPATAQSVLDFWFGPADDPGHASTRPHWFRKDAAFDAEIVRRFGPLIEQALAGGLEDWCAAQFAYLPFEHAEDRTMQRRSVELFAQLGRDEPALAGLLEWAQRHHDIVDRFGRFPHRNAVLGRTSSAEEVEFLKQPGSGF